jgi:ribosomal protein S18 acetylase RimI-like enzyme
VAFPEDPQGGGDGDWQLRGMAVADGFQKQGLGGELVRACTEAIRKAGGQRIWCNARKSAANFYAGHGWKIVSEEFDIPTVGPHFRMSVAV